MNLEISNSYVCIFLLQFNRVFILQQENQIVFFVFCTKNEKNNLKGKKKKEKPFISLKKERSEDRKNRKISTSLFFQIEKFSQFSRIFFVLKKWNVFFVFSKKANFYFFPIGEARVDQKRINFFICSVFIQEM
jgi:hypothetical protein